MARRVINGFLVIGMLLAMLPAAAQEDKLRLAFQQEGVKNAPSRVVVIFSTKANPKTLANRVELTGRHVTPALSPDGHTLAFAAQVGVKYQLFTWALDEYNTVVGAPKRLSPDANTDDKFPSWSPDGTQLAYLSTDDTKKAALCVINSDGTGRKVLESGNNVLAGYPSWRNDGKAILYIASANGKRVMRRVDPESAYPVTLSAPGPIAATFSPDGTQIAALVPGKAGDSSILVYNEAGTTAKAILGSIKRATCITWPLAQRIIFNGVQVGTRKGGPFWSIAPTGGDAKVFLA
jgi:Tol biopolymer transport system component